MLGFGHQRNGEQRVKNLIFIKTIICLFFSLAMRTESALATEYPFLDGRVSEAVFELTTAYPYSSCVTNPYAAWMACNTREGIQFINLRDQAQNFIFNEVTYVLDIGVHTGRFSDYHNDPFHDNSHLKVGSSRMFFSPDGQKALYIEEVDLWLIDLVTQKVTNITPNDLPTYSEIIMAEAGRPDLLNVIFQRIYVGENGGFHKHKLVKHLFFDFRTVEFSQGNDLPPDDRFRFENNFQYNFKDFLSGNIVNMDLRNTLLIIRPDHSFLQIDLPELIKSPSLVLGSANFIGFNQSASEGFIFSCFYVEGDPERKCNKSFQLNKIDVLSGKVIKTLELNFSLPITKDYASVFLSEKKNQMIGFFGDDIKVIDTDLNIVQSYQLKNTQRLKVVDKKYVVAAHLDENQKTSLSFVDVEGSECRQFEDDYMRRFLFDFVNGSNASNILYSSLGSSALLSVVTEDSFTTTELPINTFELGRVEYRVFDLSLVAPQPLTSCFE